MTDPRNVSDLLSAPGDFITVDQSGDVQLLKTYGMLRIKVQDEDNEQLGLAGNMKVYLDADKVIIKNKQTYKWHFRLSHDRNAEAYCTCIIHHLDLTAVVWIHLKHISN